MSKHERTAMVTVYKGLTEERAARVLRFFAGTTDFMLRAYTHNSQTGTYENKQIVPTVQKIDGEEYVRHEDVTDMTQATSVVVFDTRGKNLSRRIRGRVNYEVAVSAGSSNINRNVASNKNPFSNS